MQRHSEVIHEDEYMYFSVEGKNPKYQRHKLAQNIGRSYKLTKIDYGTVFIEKRVQFVKKVSRLSVLIAPKPQTKKEVEAILKPISIDG